MKHYIKLSVIFFLTIMSSVFAADVKPEISDDNMPPLIIRGADIKEVSRIVFDEIPKSAYRAVPMNNQLKIVFDDFQYSFLEQDLLGIGLLKNIKKLSVDKIEGHTILVIDYSCACQGDFYKWYNKKLVLDVFSLDAVDNPLKRPQSVQNKQSENEKNLDQKKNNKISEKDQDQVKKVKQEVNKPAQKDTIKNDIVKKNDEKKSDFETHLKNLVKKAHQEGIVTYKENKKEASADAVAELIKQTQKKEEKASKKEKNTKKITSVGARKKKIKGTVETEKLLPTDTTLSSRDGDCYPDSAFKLPQNDPAYDNFYDKVSDYRNDLIGEFDTVDPESALKLAHHYISYGLGEEALQVLSNFPVPEQRGVIAKSMAELLTNRTLSSKSVFKNSDECSDSQALWTAYRYYRLGDEKRAAKLSNFSHAAAVLKKFPVTLQVQIGSSLALNLVRNDSYASALDLVKVLAMSTGQFNPSVLLVRGLIDAKNGFEDRALKTLENVMNKTQGVDQQMAGLALSELKLALNYELNQRDMSILEELVFLKGREMSGVQALSLIAENESRYGNFHRAFKRLSQKVYHNPQVKDPAYIKAEQLFKRIALSGEGNLNPKTFSVYWEFNNLIPKDPIYLDAFANKLFEHGYDKASVKVINDIQEKFPDYEQKKDITFLKAKALYRQGHYKKVFVELSGIDDDHVKYAHLKAMALNKNGNVKQAIALLSNRLDKKSKQLLASYAISAGEWQAAKDTYDTIDVTPEKKELYYRTKASAYMAGYQYPGSAKEYKNPEDVVFHQPEKQAKNINNIVSETKKIIKLLKTRSEKISDILTRKIEI